MRRSTVGWALACSLCVLDKEMSSEGSGWEGLGLGDTLRLVEGGLGRGTEISCCVCMRVEEYNNTGA